MVRYKYLTRSLAQGKFPVKVSSGLLFLPSSTCQYIILPGLLIALKMVHAPELPTFPSPAGRFLLSQHNSLSQVVGEGKMIHPKGRKAGVRLPWGCRSTKWIPWKYPLRATGFHIFKGEGHCTTQTSWFWGPPA